MLKIGDVIKIHGTQYRILADDNTHFCLNNLEEGGCIRFYGWKQSVLYSDSDIVKRLIEDDITAGRCG